MPLSGIWLSISLVSVRRFGILVSLKVFASPFVLVRGHLSLLVSIFVSVLFPGLTKGPLLLFWGLIGASGFVAWFSVRFSVYLNTDMDIKGFVGLFVGFQCVKNWLHLVSKKSVWKGAALSLKFEVSDTSFSILLMKESLCNRVRMDIAFNTWSVEYKVEFTDVHTYFMES